MSQLLQTGSSDIGLLSEPDLFGHIAAEEEQNDITSYFQETSVFSNIYSGNKYLVLGRKGSGKTALFYYLQKILEKNGQKVATMTLNDYPQARFSDLKATTVDITEAHVQTWKFALLLTIMGLYLDAVEKTGTTDPNRRDFRTFYNENSLSHISSSLWTSVSDFIRSLESINVSALGIGGGFTRNLKQVARTDFAHHANQINSRLLDMLTASLSQYLPEGRLTILIDRLDEQWRNQREDNALLIGLLKACREINRELTRCRVVVFLRTDIFERLQFQNRAHLTEYIQYIRWTKEDLEQVIARRIAAKLQNTNTPDSSTTFVRDMWSLVFADIDNDRYHAPKGEGQRLMKFFESNSFLRPRDYIQLAKCLQDAAILHRQRLIVPKVGTTRLDRIAELDYSQRVFLEFQDEVMDVLPELGVIRNIISQDLKYYRFRLDEFKQHLNGRVTHDPVEILRILFDYSIVGIDNIGGTGHVGGPGGRGSEYKYQHDHVQFDGTEMFKFHPSVRLYLQLAARSLKPKTPIAPKKRPITRKNRASVNRKHNLPTNEQQKSLWDSL